jgi:oxalate decarboxylase
MAILSLRPGACNHLWDPWRTKTAEFGPGQVAFIKQGFGHFVEQLGEEPTKVLILFNSPVYEEISSWLAANPAQMIADNFGITKEVVDKLPKKLRPVGPVE